jgi:hypothetical protein
MAAHRRFCFHGVNAELRGCPEAVDRLAMFFWAFRAEGAARCEFRVELRRASPDVAKEIPRRLVADQVVPRGVVYNSGQQSWVDHFGRALSAYDFAADAGWVEAPDVVDLVELGYLMVHSRLGDHLSRHGYVRLHALGFVRDGQAGLVLGPSGSGKSSLAVRLLRDERVRLLGDDVVLIDRHGQAVGFPVPPGASDPARAVGLGPALRFERRLHPPKWVIGLSEGLVDRFTQEAAPVRLLALLARASAPPSRMVPCATGETAAALWRDMVVGLGLPQVLELIARRGGRDLLRQARPAWQRALRAARLLRSCRGVRLEVADVDQAVPLLVRGIAQ